jgi:hypothetical protein
MASFGVLHFSSTRCLFIEQHRSRFSQNVIPAAAPPPLFRDLHQSALDRVVMHVTNLLLNLGLAPHDEIVGGPLQPGFGLSGDVHTSQRNVGTDGTYPVF